MLEGGKRRLDLSIQDGGPFDADGQLNGSVTLAGVVGQLPMSSTAPRPKVSPGALAF